MRYFISLITINENGESYIQNGDKMNTSAFKFCYFLMLVYCHYLFSYNQLTFACVWERSFWIKTKENGIKESTNEQMIYRSCHILKTNRKLSVIFSNFEDKVTQCTCFAWKWKSKDCRLFALHQNLDKWGGFWLKIAAFTLKCTLQVMTAITYPCSLLDNWSSQSANIDLHRTCIFNALLSINSSICDALPEQWEDERSVYTVIISIL